MANKIIREELKARGVRHWELAAALGISEQTMVRRLRFELDENFLPPIPKHKLKVSLWTVVLTSLVGLALLLTALGFWLR